MNGTNVLKKNSKRLVPVLFALGVVMSLVMLPSAATAETDFVFRTPSYTGYATGYLPTPWHSGSAAFESPKMNAYTYSGAISTLGNMYLHTTALKITDVASMSLGFKFDYYPLHNGQYQVLSGWDHIFWSGQMFHPKDSSTTIHFTTHIEVIDKTTGRSIANTDGEYVDTYVIATVTRTSSVPFANGDPLTNPNGGAGAANYAIYNMYSDRSYEVRLYLQAYEYIRAPTSVDTREPITGIDLTSLTGIMTYYCVSDDFS